MQCILESKGCRIGSGKRGAERVVDGKIEEENRGIKEGGSVCIIGFCCACPLLAPIWRIYPTLSPPTKFHHDPMRRREN